MQGFVAFFLFKSPFCRILWRLAVRMKFENYCTLLVSLNKNRNNMKGRSPECLGQLFWST